MSVSDAIGVEVVAVLVIIAAHIQAMHYNSAQDCVYSIRKSDERIRIVCACAIH